LHAVAKRILVRPELRGHRLVDNCDASGTVTIILGEIASLHKRDVHRRKVIEFNRVYDRGNSFGFLVLLLAFYDEAGFLTAPQRQVGGPGDRDDARHARSAVARLFVKLLRTCLVVTGLAWIEHEECKMPGLVAGIDGVLVLDAAKEHRCNYEQNKRNRDLAGEECVGQVKGAVSPTSGSRFFLEHFANGCAGRAQSRHDAEYQSRQYRDCEGKAEDGWVDPEVSEVLSIFGGAQG
jgi:hypothetical protein